MTSSHAFVAYENNWREAAWVDFKLVRGAAPAQAPKGFKPRQGELIEVKARQAPEEPYGWWRARVLATSESDTGTIYMVHFEGWDDQYDDVVQQIEIRPLNKNPTIESRRLAKAEIDIPDGIRIEGLDQGLYSDVANAARSAGKPNTVFSLFVKQVPANPRQPQGRMKAVLVCIGSSNDARAAQLLAKLRFKHAREVNVITKQTFEIQQQLEEQKKRLSSCFTLRVPIIAGTIGIIIGKGGSNIKKAYAIEGVEQIDVNEKEMKVVIVAKTRESAEQARGVLEVVKTAFPIPQRIFGRFVGPKYEFVNEVRNDSGVIGLRAANKPRLLDVGSPREDAEPADGKDDWSEEPQAKNIRSVIDLEIVGSPSNVQTALMLIKTRLNHIEENTSMITARNKANRQLNTLQREHGLSRRGGGGRGGRGRSRGRGRGRGRGEGRSGGRDSSAADASRDEKKTSSKKRRDKRKGGAGAKKQGGNPQQQPKQPKQQQRRQQGDAGGKKNPSAKPAADEKKAKGSAGPGAVAMTSQPQREKRSRRRRGKRGAAAGGAEAKGRDAAAGAKDKSASGGGGSRKNEGKQDASAKKSPQGSAAAGKGVKEPKKKAAAERKQKSPAPKADVSSQPQQ